jgi:hypothetical protein
MCIDGRPIKMMPVLQGNWKGYDLYYPESGSGLKMALLHRKEYCHLYRLPGNNILTGV